MVETQVFKSLVNRGTLPFDVPGLHLSAQVYNVDAHLNDVAFRKLKFLGRAVLKTIHSMVAVVKNPREKVGALTKERGTKLSNRSLADIGTKMELNHIIVSKQWPWRSVTVRNGGFPVPQWNLVADAVKVLIGFHFINGNYGMTAAFLDTKNIVVRACDWLKISVDLKSGEEYATGGVEVPPLKLCSTNERVGTNFVRMVEGVMQYEFRDKRHLVLALTHRTFDRNIECTYERYEYLGDAILGSILSRYFFCKYPYLSPGALVTLHDRAVSNELLARVTVAWSIHRALWHNNSDLRPEEISILEEIAQSDKPDSDDVYKSIVFPKVFADLFESIIGAIVIDEGMRISRVEEIVIRLMEKELNRSCNPHNFRHNPVSRLVIFSQQQKMLLQFDHDYPRGGMHLCRATINGEKYGSGTGPTERLAKRRASLTALRRLENEYGINLVQGNIDE